MNEIRRVVRRAGLRLAVAEFLVALVWTLTAGVAAAAVCVIVSRLFAIEMPWKNIATYAPIGAVAIAMLWAILRRPAVAAIARRIDEGANLKETLSTAMAITNQSDPWSRTVVEVAARTAISVDVRRAVPIRSPRAWPVPFTAALVLVALWVLMPSFDLLKNKAKAEAVKKDQAVVDETKVQTQEALKRVEDAIAKVDPGHEKDAEKSNGDKDKADPKTPEEIRRAAVKKIESMKEKLESLKASNEKALSAEALKNMLKQVRQPGPGPLADVAGALSKGDFKSAEAALDEMSKSLSAGQMSPEDKKTLEKQLDKMKDQLAQLAGSQKKAEDMLEKAGLNKDLAKATPEQLKKALEQVKDMTQAQKDQLQKAIQAQQQAQSQCQNMSQAMDNMCQGMKKDGSGKPGSEGMSEQAQQGMQQMQEQLSQAEMMSQESNSLDAAMSEAQNQMENMMKGMGECQNPGDGQCQGGLCNGQGDGDKGSPFGDDGNPNSVGKGYGKGGMANGGRPADAAAAENWSKRNFKTALGQGPTIGTMLVQGEQIKGESKAQFQATAEAANAAATEALENNTIPREYHDAVKAYFGRLAKKVQATGGAPAAGPAATAPDAKATGGNSANPGEKK